MPANGFDSLLISAHPQFPSETFALIDWENGRMEFSVGTGCITAYASAACLVLSSQIPGCDQNSRILITICRIVIKTQELRSQFPDCHQNLKIVITQFADCDQTPRLSSQFADCDHNPRITVTISRL